MKFRTIGYYFKQAFKSMRRNFWMSVAAVSTVAIAAFLVGIFALLVTNVNFMATKLESDIEVVAFVEVDVPRSEVLQLEEQIRSLPGIASVTLVPKEQGLEQMYARYGRDRDLLGALGGDNPLPDYFVVKAREPERVGRIAGQLAQIPQIYKVDYGQQEVERLFQVLGWVRWAGSALILLLVGAAVFLIATTVRLTVFARRRELQIMKLVGASDWFIRWPFFLEGFFLGAFGAALACLALYFGYFSLLDQVTTSISFLALVTDRAAVYEILWKLLAGGAAVGALGSIISMRRFLKV